MPLKEYRRKRDFAQTPEPKGAPRRDSGRLYVIHKHAARRLHYDLRLELDGVLLSWAIPKGPSLDPADKHLAVRVEDHPVEYGSFEGVIPAGEYGAGTVMLWDRGAWEPARDPHEGLAEGDLKFALRGEKLRGEWVLVRMKRRSEEEGKENWLLIKHRDREALAGDGGAVLRERAGSVASGRSMEEIAEDRQSVWHSEEPASAQTEVRPPEETRLEPGDLPGARPQAEPPRFVEPELATLVREPPPGEAWVHEIKFDGYRAVARIREGAVAMHSRRDHDWTGRFRSIAEELAGLPVGTAVLDGEVVVQLPDGTTSFQTLQRDLGEGRRDRLLYFVFDLLHLDGYDLTGVPLTERKRTLRRLVSRLGPGSRVRYSEDVTGNGPAVFRQACGYGLEGVVSKRAGSRYRPGARGKDWLKVKCLQRQEFVIVGWTDPSRSRVGFGALLLGVQESGGLRYAGKVGTGFDDRFLRGFGERLREIPAREPPLTRGRELAPKRVHWVRPEHVAEVEFTEWTEDGQIRHPSFKGLREDKAPEEVVPEMARPTREVTGPTGDGAGVRNARSSARGIGGETAFGGVRITNPGRVLYPVDGITKMDLIEFYDSIAEWIMPHVRGRPIAMVRCPEGIRAQRGEVREDEPGPCFFHKHPGEDFPGPFERLTIRESEGPQVYLAPTEPASLTGLVQMGVLEIHVWGCRGHDVEHPDMMVFDLDPSEETPWNELIQAARLVRGVLKGLGLESFVKTTGGKGLHVVVPLAPAEDWAGVHAAARAIAEGIVSYAPDKYTSKMSKARRVGKVYVDYVRNARSATSIAAYSTRARPHATVSVPLRWEELTGSTRSDAWTVRNLRKRLSHLKGDPWEGYFDAEQTITRQVKRDLGLE
ncbi:MAG: DNA ligase D [Coriobacteriia bacterium]|nr:DNA ligase D [Coriobacteriia bacterium]